ncbi:hypothetical protein [Bradyrhizobium japonicum]|uniref:hypothetical protein n=1 Tax=Bradyrhizobium japonicum TaxID=375 RepID=UPI00054E457C|nr:hypothetical protein [Bradyrhizobium japonicum]WLB91316.1 hypothetical protein QIH91_13390 [Bradyrhizobium japonicum USDA 135]
MTDSAASTATSVVSANLRAKCPSAALATVADIVTLSGSPSVLGNWLVPALRCKAGGLPVINSSSVGIAYAPSPTGLTPSGPLRINAPDQRTSCM